MCVTQISRYMTLYTQLHKYTMMYQSNTTKLYNVYYCIRATCLDSYRIILRPFQDTDPYLAMFKACCGIPNAYIFDKTMYKMHVSLCSYCTIRILISKTLNGTYEAGYAYVFKMYCYRTLGIVVYIVANYLTLIYIFYNYQLYTYITIPKVP